MIKTDLSAHAASLIRSTNSLSNRRRVKNTFDTLEDDHNSDDVTVKKEAPVHPTNVLQRLSILNQSSVQSKAQQVVRYADTLLDQLQGLQHHILMGALSYVDLQKLEFELKNSPLTQLHTSTELESILSDIQVRVAVELAKHMPNKSK